MNTPCKQIAKVLSVKTLNVSGYGLSDTWCNIRNILVCPHSVYTSFLCFCIWKEIISVKTLSGFSLVEMRCTSCEAEIQYLNIVQMGFVILQG
jgi:hypothetical protein